MNTLMKPMLGRLERVNLRKAWLDEAIGIEPEAESQKAIIRPVPGRYR